MKCQRIRCEIESRGDGTRRHTLGSGLYKQAENIKAIVLGECGQGRNDICLFHISMNIEMIERRQLSFQHLLKYFQDALQGAHDE
jgi:hypothetical protein